MKIQSVSQSVSQNIALTLRGTHQGAQMAGCLWLWVVVFLAVVSLTQSQPGPGPSCLCFEELGTPDELFLPTVITHANDGSGRIFVAELRGFIWIYRQDGSRFEIPFLNLTNNDVHLTDSKGLVSFTFHPEFTSNGLIYTSYTKMIDGIGYQRISEFSLSESDPNVVDPTTERIIMDTYYGPSFGHTGGGLLFGEDGYFYFTFGDGGCCYDPEGNGQNKSTILGSMARIDVDTRTGELPYAIPPDNPFLDEPDAVPEIYAYGLRNPFTVSKDIGDRNTGAGKGRIFFGDVGEVDFEEVDLLERGGNYGWAVWEGSLCLEPDLCDNIGSYVPPIIVYNRTMGVSVMLGGVYRGCAIPDLNEWLLFLDYRSTIFFGATESSPGSWDLNVIPKCEICPDDLTSEHGSLITVIGADQSGEYYFGAINSLIPDRPVGTLYRIVDPNNPGAAC